MSVKCNKYIVFLIISYEYLDVSKIPLMQEDVIHPLYTLKITLTEVGLQFKMNLYWKLVRSVRFDVLYSDIYRKTLCFAKT